MQPWEGIIDALIDILDNIVTANEQAILAAARKDASTPFQISQDDINDALAGATVAIERIDDAVVDDFIEKTATVVTRPNFSDNSDEVLRFYVVKHLTESVNRIHSAEIARQVEPINRETTVAKALDRSLQLIRDTMEAEGSTGFALKHQELAILNDFHYYIYRTSEDEAVRSEHVSRNGRAFVYGNERTVDDVPGLANHCRCFAEPITLEEALNATFFYSEDAPSIPA